MGHIILSFLDGLNRIGEFNPFVSIKHKNQYVNIGYPVHYGCWVGEKIINYFSPFSFI